MIPKIIHYCWFGNNPLPNDVLHNIDTWKKILPDYKICRWDESNFDVSQMKYTYEAYKVRKYAFVSDVCRLQALYRYGGIYLDTDVEVIKTFNECLNHSAFLGLETLDTVGTAVIGAEKESIFIKECLSYYEGKCFIKPNGDLNDTPNSRIISNLIKDEFLSDIVYIYNKSIFSPKSYVTGKIRTTKNTICIHHFAGTWVKSKDMNFLAKIKKKLWYDSGLADIELKKRVKRLFSKR